MKFYYAGLTVEAVEQYNRVQPGCLLSAMLSFGRPAKERSVFTRFRRELVDQIAFDSSTWTLNNSRTKNGLNLTLENYATALKFTEGRWNWYVNFDEDFTQQGVETNWDNQDFLEGRGFSPVPVIHDCESDEVSRCIDRGYERVAIGSSEIAGKNKPPLIKAVLKLHRAGIKVHLLGTTDNELLSMLPIHSSDSSTWTQAASRDYIYFFNPVTGHKDTIYLERKQPDGNKKAYFTNYQWKSELVGYLAVELGLRYIDLIGPSSQVPRQVVNLHYFNLMEKRIHEAQVKAGFFPE